MVAYKYTIEKVPDGCMILMIPLAGLFAAAASVISLIT